MGLRTGRPFAGWGVTGCLRLYSMCFAQASVTFRLPPIRLRRRAGPN